MVFCITFLRAIAAIIITNSHYTGVYPSDIIANGGLLGDVIFFAVSGFCLYNVKMNFGKWYIKRIVRVYPAPIIITAVYMLIGFYAKAGNIGEFIEWFIYPTNYHFVASIILLYIPFYFVMKYDRLKNNMHYLMIVVFAVYMLIYVFGYDRSYYHIDTVREPMIRFLFFEAMLLGAYFKHNFEKFKDKSKITDYLIAGVVFIIYFASKILFSNRTDFADFQFMNQIFLIVFLYFLMKAFLGIDSKLENLPAWIKKVVAYLSEITLEIYVVQYAIIPRIAGMQPFPVNWLAITAAILGSASILHLCVQAVNKGTDKLFKWTVKSKGETFNNRGI